MSHHAETRGIYLFAQYTIPQKPSYATWTNLYKSTLVSTSSFFIKRLLSGIFWKIIIVEGVIEQTDTSSTADKISGRLWRRIKNRKRQIR